MTQESWGSGVSSGTHTYGYDTTNQLTAADGTVFGYDANGNRNYGSYQVGTSNRTTNDGTYTYTYDSEGNLTQKSKGTGLETWYYGYDTRNLLTSVRQTTNGTTNQFTATYTYDALSRRVQQDGWDGTTLVTTEYAFGGDNRVWAELNGSTVVQYRYLNGNGATAVLARINVSGGTVAWVVQDRLGSVRDVTDSTQVNTHDEYGPFGIITSESNPATGVSYGYTGLFQDRYTFLGFADNRVLDPTTAKWLQQDPIVFQAGDANLQRYVGNNATNAVDPSGLEEAPPRPILRIGDVTIVPPLGMRVPLEMPGVELPWEDAPRVLALAKDSSLEQIQRCMTLLDTAFSLSGRNLPWIDPIKPAAKAPTFTEVPLDLFAPLDRQLMPYPGRRIRTKQYANAAVMARISIRINLVALKTDIVNEVFNMLKTTTPVFPGAGKLTDKDYAQAANQVADRYIRAVDDFLATHPGAKPKLGKRTPILEKFGIETAVTAPWCADWAQAMTQELFGVNRMIGTDWGQWKSGGAEHNFLIVRSKGYLPTYPAKETTNILLFDPWRDLLPRVFKPMEPYLPTNTFQKLD